MVYCFWWIRTYFHSPCGVFQGILFSRSLSLRPGVVRSAYLGARMQSSFTPLIPPLATPRNFAFSVAFLGEFPVFKQQDSPAFDGVNLRTTALEMDSTSTFRRVAGATRQPERNPLTYPQLW